MNTFLAITYSFLLTWTPCHSLGASFPDKSKSISEYYFNATHVEYQIGLDLFDMFQLYTGEATYQVPDGSIFNWQPYRQLYWLGLEFHYEFNDGLKIRAGVEHQCTHPVQCWGDCPSVFNESGTEVYLGVSGKIPLF